METKLAATQHHLMSPGVSHMPNPRYSSAAAAYNNNNNNNILSVSVMAKPTNTSLTSDYKDNWFDRIAINHLSNSLQATIGFRSNKSGYEGLVEATAMTRQKFSPTQQRQLVIQALDAAFPKPILSFIRAVLPPSKFQRECFAVFTTIFFPWLVGPCEVREAEINGRAEKNVVHIKKCRFLEESNCVGMCTNLCKMPSQAFIKDSFGLPFNKVPNFDDMSCEMIFGQEPPATTDDPAFKQPCYKLCNMKQKFLH